MMKVKILFNKIFIKIEVIVSKIITSKSGMISAPKSLLIKQLKNQKNVISVDTESLLGKDKMIIAIVHLIVMSVEAIL